MLNKQGPGKIDWCDDTWNPIAGKCHHNCSYCYMHRFWRLRDNAKHLLKKNYLSDRMPENPSKIFVGSSTDMWGEWVDEEWIHQVLAIPDKHPEHTYQFLTKNPSRYDDFYCWDMKNCWFGTTDDGTPQTKNNIRDLIISVDYPAIITFASFEPLLAEITSPHLSLHMKFLDWIIIGADSNRGAKKPPKEWADRLIDVARENDTAVWVKDNYGYPEIIKEFPK